MMRWLRRLFGGTGESYDEAHARIAAEIERDYPIEQTRAEARLRTLQAAVALEERRKRLDAGGEYERGIEGMQ